jgi:hypothetical protein
MQQLPWFEMIVSMGAGGTALAVALARRRRPPAPESPPAIRDVLEGELKRSSISESFGVRWELALFPESLSVPGYAVLTAIVQNAYDQLRAATLEIPPCPLFPTGHTCSVALNGGEAGILRIPVFVSRATPIGEYALRAQLKARAPRGEGTRLLPPPRRSPAQRTSLRVVSTHDGTPVNLFAYDWKGFTSLYIPPDTKADLTELRILQELPSVPGGE